MTTTMTKIKRTNRVNLLVAHPPGRYRPPSGRAGSAGGGVAEGLPGERARNWSGSFKPASTARLVLVRLRRVSRHLASEASSSSLTSVSAVDFVAGGVGDGLRY